MNWPRIPRTSLCGVMDRDGFLTMRGRFAELIEVGGITWFPRNVEEALCAERGAKEAALVAVPDAALGQRPVAFVTLASEALDPAALKEAAARRLHSIWPRWS